jgi:signal transduction histidine kinase
LLDQDEGALVRLRHDMRQYVAAGVLLSLQPGDEHLDPEIRARLRHINQLFARMRELTETPPAESERSRRTPRVDLVELVDECVSVARLTHAVPLDVSGDVQVEASVDPVMLRRAVNNVLDNATRAAGESGQVRVGVHRMPGQAVVEVTDDGNGFGRIPSVSGHGMSVVDQALRACHGRLEIFSGPGPGTTVRLLIPAQAGPGELS